MMDDSIKLCKSYTVAWITALPLERAAAEAMFDLERDDPPEGFRKRDGDDNEYSWGKVGRHHVVIASLPSGEYGLASAARVAQGFRSSLPHIRVGLLVGIGAGIPGPQTDGTGSITFEPDIRLGDVVVSRPDGITGGVIQFDFVQSKEHDGRHVFKRHGFLNSPPSALRSALSKLQARYERKDSKILDLMKDAFSRYPKMSQTYAHPCYKTEGEKQVTDVYQLKDGRQIERDARETPEVHFGTIASGNTLEKSAAHRDEVLSRLKAEGINPLCIEMEAAGLMNSFPCLVIRGICDYADRHKNDDWQRYAAMAAAGFAKEFLECVEPLTLTDTPELSLVYDTCK
jgi:nucleoside phosphorylase